VSIIFEFERSKVKITDVKNLRKIIRISTNLSVQRLRLSTAGQWRTVAYHVGTRRLHVWQHFMQRINDLYNNSLLNIESTQHRKTWFLCHISATYSIGRVLLAVLGAHSHLLEIKCSTQMLFAMETETREHCFTLSRFVRDSRAPICYTKLYFSSILYVSMLYRTLRSRRTYIQGGPRNGTIFCTSYNFMKY